MTFEKPITRPSEPVRHKISVAEFLALDEAGFFEGRRVELIDGRIYEMAPLYFPHGRIHADLITELNLALRAIGGFDVATPVSTELSKHDLPEADIVVARQGGGDRFATPEVVQLLVEVSASSLNHDLGRKVRLYASFDVPEYWVADVNARRIIRFHSPEGETYRERAEFAFGEAVPSATIAGLTVDTSRLA
jgi:Uma2 family endonuclease